VNNDSTPTLIQPPDALNSNPPHGHVDKPLTRLAHMPTGPHH